MRYESCPVTEARSGLEKVNIELCESANTLMRKLYTEIKMKKALIK